MFGESFRSSFSDGVFFQMLTLKLQKVLLPDLEPVDALSAFFIFCLP